MIIDTKIKKLVLDIERSEDQSNSHTENKIKELIIHLKERCALPEVRAKYESYENFEETFESYPIDKDGYAKAIDPIENEGDFVDAWFKYGVVVGKDVIPTDLSKSAITRMQEILFEISDKSCDLSKPKTCDNMPVDTDNTPILSRGFFEIYHDDVLAQIRQSIRVYLHHVLLWGQAELWTSFDRFGVKLPDHQESYALPVHVDQNPLVHPGFKTTQGILALSDCPLERGVTVVVPGSKKYFVEYREMASRMENPQGEYVELDQDDDLVKELVDKTQPIPLRGGNLISWDSRTMHANTTNTSDQIRFVAIISAGPARENDDDLVKARTDAYKTGLGINMREALMHASKRPRYTNHEMIKKTRKPEHLTLLGKLLYGQKKYEEI